MPSALQAAAQAGRRRRHGAATGAGGVSRTPVQQLAKTIVAAAERSGLTPTAPPRPPPPPPLSSPPRSPLSPLSPLPRDAVERLSAELLETVDEIVDGAAKAAAASSADTVRDENSRLRLIAESTLSDLEVRVCMCVASLRPSHPALIPRRRLATSSSRLGPRRGSSARRGSRSRRGRRRSSTAWPHGS